MKDTSRPAFPSANEIKLGDYSTFGHTGVTKREWYAAVAMTVVIDTAIAQKNTLTPEDFAGKCFDIADAMIFEGKK